MARPDLHAHAAYDPLLTAAEAAKYLGLHVETLRAMARAREIASIKAGAARQAHTRYRLSALNAWVRRHEKLPLPAMPRPAVGADTSPPHLLTEPQSLGRTH